MNNLFNNIESWYNSNDIFLHDCIKLLGDENNENFLERIKTNRYKFSAIIKSQIQLNYANQINLQNDLLSFFVIITQLKSQVHILYYNCVMRFFPYPIEGDILLYVVTHKNQLNTMNVKLKKYLKHI